MATMMMRREHTRGRRPSRQAARGISDEVTPGRNVMRVSGRRMLAASVLLALPVAQAWAHAGWGIVVDGKNQVYFTDVDRSRIWRIDARGKLGVFVSGKHSHDVALDSRGNIVGEHVSYDGKEFHGSAWIA